MSLNIKNAEVVRLTRELADLMGTTQVSALESALRGELARRAEVDREDREARIRADVQGLRALVAAGASLPSRRQLDDELYDADGLYR